uniref:Lactoylglutathione lyase n=1 Tax=Acidicaldus sp. TaxID=1872105 RepID=A0A8J4H9S7_9PROT
MAKAIHTMIRVRDEARAVAFYRAAFGLDVAERLVFPGFTLVYLRNGEADFELELTINADRNEPYQLGDGYGHLAFVVDDLDAEHQRFTAAGFAPTAVKELQQDGARRARFCFLTDPDGYRIEVLEKFGRYR